MAELLKMKDYGVEAIIDSEVEDNKKYHFISEDPWEDEDLEFHYRSKDYETQRILDTHADWYDDDEEEEDRFSLIDNLRKLDKNKAEQFEDELKIEILKSVKETSRIRALDLYIQMIELKTAFIPFEFQSSTIIKNVIIDDYKRFADRAVVVLMQKHNFSELEISNGFKINFHD